MLASQMMVDSDPSAHGETSPHMGAKLLPPGKPLKVTQTKIPREVNNGNKSSIVLVSNTAKLSPKVGEPKSK